MILTTLYVRGTIFSEGHWFSFEVSDEDANCNVCVKYPLNYMEQFEKNPKGCYSFYKQMNVPYSEFAEMQTYVFKEIVSTIKTQIKKDNGGL
jgi:hypothetical protein